MNYHIAIPSYQRYECITLSLLDDVMDKVTVFVANQDEYTKYKERHSNIKMVIGEKGIMNQRNFITNYYDNNEIIVCMDDDIKGFLCQERSVKHMLEDCVTYLSQSKLSLMSFPPTINDRFIRPDGSPYTEGNYLTVGVFHIYKNDKSIQLYTCLEDYERSCEYIRRDGAIIRCWNVCYKHKPLAKGGLTEYRKNPNSTINATNTMIYKYSDMLIFKYRVNSLFAQIRIRLKTYDKPKVIKLPNTNMFNELISILEISKLRQSAKVTGNRRGGRLNFPQFKGGTYGKVRERIGQRIVAVSAMSKQNPVLWEEMKRIGEIICPFPFTSVQLNKNLQCPKHKDRQNCGDSMLVSFGDYTGNNIVVDGVEYDARANPVIFNGSQLEHYNTEQTGGTKYSLVYYSM